MVRATEKDGVVGDQGGVLFEGVQNGQVVENVGGGGVGVDVVDGVAGVGVGLGREVAAEGEGTVVERRVGRLGVEVVVVAGGKEGGSAVHIFFPEIAQVHAFDAAKFDTLFYISGGAVSIPGVDGEMGVGDNDIFVIFIIVEFDPLEIAVGTFLVANATAVQKGKAVFLKENDQSCADGLPFEFAVFVINDGTVVVVAKGGEHSGHFKVPVETCGFYPRFCFLHTQNVGVVLEDGLDRIGKAHRSFGKFGTAGVAGQEVERHTGNVVFHKKSSFYSIVS